MAKRRPHGDGMVRKRSDGRWEAHIVIGHKADGKPMYKSFFGKTQKEVLAKLHEGIELFRDVDLTEESKISLTEWLNRWLNDYVAYSVRESTYISYRNMVKNQVVPFIGNIPLSKLTRIEMQKFYNKVKKEGRVRVHPVYGKELSDAMVRSIHMMLHQALDVAVRERLIVLNPTNGTTIPRCNYVEKQLFTEAQLETFLRALPSYPEWQDFFYTEILTGLRRGEICALKWNDFDENSGKLHIKRSISKGNTVGETKTSTGNRSILLPPSVKALLIKLKREAISEWIFYNYLDPNLPMTPDRAYRVFKLILKNAGLPDIRFHDLRHLFATNALRAGIDPKTLSRLLGHTSPNFSINTYTSQTADMQRNAAEAMNTMFEKFKIGD